MRCKSCKGKGVIEKEIKLGSNQRAERIREECPVCEGHGRIQQKVKRGCKDKGYDWSID